ncbi:MAG: VOC family protein [Deltaproteobacteria bacterium]|nr:MAG: VOC family protein [Deltaproteobacteria bacterium]
MIQSLNPFLNFTGQASQAMEFYEDTFGTKAEGVMRWSDGPGEETEETANNIMYARIPMGGGAIEISDVPPHITLEQGTSMQVILHMDDPKELDAIFAKLSEGGQVQMPPDDMFWGARYAKCIDSFGVCWALHCDLNNAS